MLLKLLFLLSSTHFSSCLICSELELTVWVRVSTEKLTFPRSDLKSLNCRLLKSCILAKGSSFSWSDMSILSLLPVLDLLVSAFLFTTVFGVLVLIGWHLRVPSPCVMVGWLLLYDRWPRSWHNHRPRLWHVCRPRLWLVRRQRPVSKLLFFLVVPRERKGGNLLSRRQLLSFFLVVNYFYSSPGGQPGGRGRRRCSLDLNFYYCFSCHHLIQSLAQFTSWFLVQKSFLFLGNWEGLLAGNHPKFNGVIPGAVPGLGREIWFFSKTVYTGVHFFRPYVRRIKYIFPMKAELNQRFQNWP